jgi:hypothetical protein
MLKNGNGSRSFVDESIGAAVGVKQPVIMQSPNVTLSAQESGHVVSIIRIDSLDIGVA